MDDLRETLAEWLGPLLIPAGLLSGYFLKRRDLPRRSDKFAYFIFASGTAFFCPDLLESAFPMLGNNGRGFLTFVCAVYGGLILFNVWVALSHRSFWASLADALARKVHGGDGHD
jgi:hypothetical protein